MPRISRIVILGIPHHIVQRGNRRSRVFSAMKITNFIKKWPLGDEKFLTKLARKTTRPVKPNPRGRPRKNEEQE